MPMVQVLLLLPAELLQEIDSKLGGQTATIEVKKARLSRQEVWEANQIAKRKGKAAMEKFVKEKMSTVEIRPLSRNEFIRQLLKKALNTK